MRKGLNARSASSVGAGFAYSVSFHLQIFLHMYRQVEFKFEGGTWTVHLPESPFAQKFGRLMDKISRQRILPYLLRNWIEGLVIKAVFIPFDLKSPSTEA